MEKQPFLPIKFYPVKEWQEWEKFKEYSQDKVIVKEHYAITPAFQMVLPNIGRHWGDNDFELGTFEIVNYDDGTTFDLTTLFISPIVFNGGAGFRTMVWNRFPGADLIDIGRRYYHLADPEGTHWYSEVFEICDLGLNVLELPGFDNESGFAVFSSTYFASFEGIQTEFCKSGAAIAEAYVEFDVFLEEELDLYIYTEDYAQACDGEDRNWDFPVYFMLKTQDELTISEIFRVDTTETAYHFEVKAEAAGTVRLYWYIQAADSTEGTVWLWMHRRYTDKHVQLRWFNDTNFCKIVYEDQPDNIAFQYENVAFLDAKQVIDENSINENVVEDDAANKYRIIGTDQKWNALQLVGSECMLNAMSLLRLHSNIKIIKENGEPIDVSEMHIEQSVIPDYASLIRLVYREESCSEDNCGFDVCCPTPRTPILIGYFVLIGSLPAAAANTGEYAMVETAARIWNIYYSNGAGWAVNATYRTTGTCVELEGFPYAYDAHNFYMRFFWASPPDGQFFPFMEINTVVDATGGIATITTHTEYWIGDDVYCQAEYYNGTEWDSQLPYFDDENWIKCSDNESLTAHTGARVISCESGAGVGIWFRVHIWSTNCDYGYSPPVQQTIT